MAELKITSKLCPKGTFLFCAVTGRGIKNEDTSKKKQDVYEYKVTLEVDEKDATVFMDEVDALVESQLGKGDKIVKLPYQTHEDYDGIPRGKVWIKAKCKTEFEDEKTGDMQQVIVKTYDSTGNQFTLPDGKGVGKGSTGKVYGKVVTWDKKEGIGATFYVSSVQIADMKFHEFGDEVDSDMGGSFKGFDSDMEKDEQKEDERPSRRSSRRDSDEDKRSSRRSSRRS